MAVTEPVPDPTVSAPNVAATPGTWLDELNFDETMAPPAVSRWRRARRWLLVPLVLVVAAAAVIWFLNPFAATPVGLVTATASTGTIVSSVSLSGSVASRTVKELTFGSSGTVTAVNVAVGDKVTKGETLATIDDSTIAVQIQTAQANLDAARAKLALDRAGPNAETRASARDSVSQAQLQLTSARQSLSDTIAQNRLSVAQATADLAAAKAALASDEKTLPSGDPQLAKDASAVTQASAALSSARLKATLSLHQAQNQVSSASLGVTSARHNYDLKVAPATSAQITSDQAAVASAQLALTNLQQGGTTLSAPIDGTVTAVNVAVGQAISTGSSSSSSSSSTTGQIEVMDLSSLQIAGEASETDIAKLKLGQAATITAAALGSETAVGKVCELSVVGTQISGVTSYGVTVCVDGATPGLLVGMSATAAVVTSRSDGAVLVPSLAVKTVGGQQVVAVLGADGKSQSNVPVTVGISNGTQTQILTGLSAGQIVVESLQSTTTNRGGPGGGGGRIFPGGFGGG